MSALEGDAKRYPTFGRVEGRRGADWQDCEEGERV
jgi:hypothetical protein